MRHYIEVFLKSMLGGFCIVVGSTGYLILKSYDMTILGAFVFGLGLYAIIHFKLWLFTSKISGVIDHGPKYSLDVLICLVTNILSVVALSALLLQTRIGGTLQEFATPLVDAKMNDTWYSILILSFMCGTMIYLAVNGHDKCSYGVGKLAFVFLSIFVFIICSYEHVIANACYFTYAGVFSWKALLYFVLMAIGNSIGAIFVQFVRGNIQSLNQEQQKAE